MEKNKDLGMDWHNFLVFCLGIRGVLGIIVAVVTIVASFMALEIPGIAVGVLSVGVSAFALVTRERLKYLSSGAINYVIGFYIAQFIVGVTDSIVAYVISSTAGFDFGDLTWDVIFMVAMLLINIPYYKKREGMFVE